MAVVDIQDYVRFLPVLNRTPHHAARLSYDVETDAFSVSFTQPSYATDSQMTDDDLIIRYRRDAIIGFTVLHASRRTPKVATDK
ncbi:MAG TPA: DUF2283 domain-containing protein [Nitrospira sp.]|nr:DUF2283 domain-containing protein [Nitrospira sp.]